MIEVVLVVRSGAAANRQGDGKGVLSAASSSDSLLVVESHGRHVRHDHCLQPTDVDARLHGRRHAQEVDTRGSGVLSGQEHVLKLRLPLLRIVTVCLSREFFTVESERATGLLSKKGI